MYSIGQGDNLLTAGKVAYPKYEVGCVTPNEYPCSYIEPNTKKRPVSIPLGIYDQEPYAENGYVERYVDNTQQKNAGEMSDGILFIIILIIAIVFGYVVFFAKK